MALRKKIDVKNKIFTELSNIESELINLKDVIYIIDNMPIEKPIPVYLVRCLNFHINELDSKFKCAWKALV